MRPLCVICTEVFVINSQITACNCGHIFHEECIFRWLKSSQKNCPQCRAKVTESTVIKRLFLTESESSSNFSTQAIQNLCNDKSGNDTEKYEDCLNKIGDLKQSLREKTDVLNAKAKLLEQRDSKIKELDELNAGLKKKLSDNQLLMDYLKKELENFNNFKEQYSLKEKLANDLESKLKEFKLIEMIYKEHESAFANEMKKCLNAPISSKNLEHTQTVMRQLVSTNVLLKEQLDKQTEDKKMLRKKLFQMEKNQSEKDKFIMKKEQEHKDLNEKYKRILEEYDSKKSELDNLKDSFKDSFKDSPRCIGSSSPAVVSTDDSDLQYLEEVGKLESNYLKKIAENKNIKNVSPLLMSPLVNNKRKNPFARSESFPKKIEAAISEEASSNKQLTISQLLDKNNTSDESDSSTNVDLVKPLAKLMKKTNSSNCLTSSKYSSEVNSVKNADSKPLVKTNENKNLASANESNRFAYQYDGLGGRKKIFLSGSTSSLNSLPTSNSNKNPKQSKLCRSKVT